MAVVHISMDTKKSAAGALLPQDIELNILALELFYYACEASHNLQISYMDDIGTSVVIDQITYSNPYGFWAFLKSIPVDVARKVLDRTLYFRPEFAKRAAEAGKARQTEISAKLDNIRKANKLRDELLKSGGDADAITKLLAKILFDQDAELEVHDASRRKEPPNLPYL
ncbi:hypothetical protein PH547_00305 [Rhizobium sp. CNPSo 3464]|uniref:hypothetical protein n=1 Tax=Rhizobium sp. CNPSo 3464 TaxID=3021406 RepID=UPI00254DA0BA|nr:hypothetical protein [Rhizobium sp. CNPSo 3464]MDK4737305.1 hypothetical protein [Rhizobium sp. CNPSo 3464]